MTRETPSAIEMCMAANTCFTRFRETLDSMNEIRAAFATGMNTDDDSFRNPFNVEYETERLRDNVMGDLARLLVRQLNRSLVPNIPIDVESFLRDLKPEAARFDAFEILKRIERDYVRDARRKSLASIQALARRLLPRAGYQEDPALGRVVKGATLRLRKRLYGGHGWSSFERGGDCDALQKFVRVVLEEADPATVSAHPRAVSEIMGPREHEQLFEPLAFGEGWIAKMRFHKNGKLVVTFKAETAARRVAMALLEKPPVA